jgi:hypothetical protein
MSICQGNYEDKFQGLMEYTGIPLSGAKTSEYSGFKEGDFGEMLNKQRIESTIRSIKCDMLIHEEVRCSSCKKTRVTLHTMLRRKAESADRQNLSRDVSSTKPNKYMSRTEIVKKANLLQNRHVLTVRNESLMSLNDRLQRTAKESIRQGGQQFSDLDSSDMFKLLAEIKDDNTLNEYQRLLMSEQLKYNQLRDKRSMRWHPTIVKWCLYIQSKSPKGYKSLKESGFLSLPSERTLYDYSHYVQGT